MRQQKLRVGVIFGGRSCEHDVSLHSAASVLANLDTQKYEVIPLGITREGTWLLGVTPDEMQIPAEKTGEQEHRQPDKAVVLAGDAKVYDLLALEDGKLVGAGPLNVVFPVLHGPYGEDGTIQGLFEMADLPYVGCGVLGSALGMDKEKMKMLFQAIHLPVIPYLVYQHRQWEQAPEAILLAVEQELGYPCIVKPVNMGSSIGVSKAEDRTTLEQAIAQAAEYDRKIIIERWLNVREVSCAVLGNEEPEISLVGELVTDVELLTYGGKYLQPAFNLTVPAALSGPQTEELLRMAKQAFLVLDLSGLARVDFFLDRTDGRSYINEVNTLPGFTQDSVYAKLWSASNLPFPQVLDRVIELALERHRDRQRLRTSQ